MSKVLLVNKDQETMESFEGMFLAFSQEGLVGEDYFLDFAFSIRHGMEKLEEDYHYIFVDRDLPSDGVGEEGLSGVETLEKKAREINPKVVITEIVNGPDYCRRVVPDYKMMKPAYYRAGDVRRILQGESEHA